MAIVAERWLISESQNHPSVLKRRSDGRRVGASDRRRNTSKRSSFSSIKSNLMLDELDRNLSDEAYASAFTTITVRLLSVGARAACHAQRQPISYHWLQLQVNESKSAVARPAERKFLSFSYHNDRATAYFTKAVATVQATNTELTQRTSGISLVKLVEPLSLSDWVGEATSASAKLH